jgi:hypothetical protein
MGFKFIHPTLIQKLAGMHMYTVQSETRICSVGTNRMCLFPDCATYVHDICYYIAPNYRCMQAVILIVVLFQTDMCWC